MEIHHKTAFEAKSLDFLAFCLISLILTEMFSYFIEFVIVYMYMYKSQTREGGENSESIIKSIMYVHLSPLFLSL